MLFLETIGYGYSKKLCQNVVCWFVAKHFSRHTLDITVSHKNLTSEGVMGFCDVVGKTNNPRSFLIEINANLDKENYCRTLIHECIHMGQFIRGELKIKNCKRYFRGISLDCQPYELQEHEKIAYTEEEVLYKLFLKENI